jgi:glycosyltransferase involved in cell wall biosynthesis
MKILIASFGFPPSNVIGAVRVGKLARYLDRRGHDVRVLTASSDGDKSLPLEIQPQRVLYTEYRTGRNWRNPLAQPFRSGQAVQAAKISAPSLGDSGAQGSSLRIFLRRQYYGFTHIPDMRADWVRTAVPAGRRLIEEWRPDIIFASAPPYTGLIVASRLARSSGIPWVADFRDLWADNLYSGHPRWRIPLDAVLERLTLRSAASLVTVSPIWAEQLRRRHGKHAELVYNGYAEEDFPPFPQNAERGHILTIRYTGSIYRGLRDPSAVFAGISLLPEELRNRVKVEFYGEAADAVLTAAVAHGVTEAVAVKPPVPYQRALELQVKADVLLLLQSNDKRDEGNLPAKLFEYLFARRPILFIGLETGVAARIIADRRAGFIANDPKRIRDQLQLWLAEKQTAGLKTLDRTVYFGLSRDEQYHKLERLFTEILAKSEPPRLFT